MSARLVNAAIQFVEQVNVMRPGGPSRFWAGAPDGLRRIRSVEFDVKTTRWLVPVLEKMEDERIHNWTIGTNKRVTVWFVPDTRADKKTPFPLLEAERLVDDQ